MIGSLGNMELVDGLHLSSALVMKTLSKYAGHAASAHRPGVSEEQEQEKQKHQQQKHQLKRIKKNK